MNQHEPPNGIKETVSEITPKAKRGRPKSFARELAEDSAFKGLGPQNAHSMRAKVDSAIRLAFIGPLLKAADETNVRIMGCTWNDIKQGTHHFPPGFDTAATEIGRWLVSYDESAEAQARALEIVGDARDEGISWTDIRAHFRKLRLGERQGNALSLFTHLARAYDEYISNFPATTDQARVAGIRNLLDAVENPE